MELGLQKKYFSELRRICQPVYDSFGVIYFSQTRAFKDGRFIQLSTKPEIIEDFLDQGLPISFTDGQGLFLKEGFYLASHLGENLYPKEKANRLQEKFKIGNVIYLVEKNETYDDLYLFGADPKNSEIINNYFNNIHLLRQFILYYKTKSQRLLAHTQAIKYPNEYMMSSWLKNNSITIPSAIDTEKFLKDIIANKTLVKGKFGEVDISKRELECLKYLVRSYTQKEMAKVMRLSPRTVETYLNNLKHKLGYQSKAECILLAEKLNLIIF